MFESLLTFFRKRKIRKYASDIPTGIIALDGISSVNVVIDVEEPEFDILKEEILAWGRKTGLKVNIYFLDFRKLGKEELLLTSITTTIIKKELDWLGTPPLQKISALLQEPSDLFISLVENGGFPIEFISCSAKARFKIGRQGFPGHAYDMVISGSPTEDLRSDVRKIFTAMTGFLEKIR